MKELKVHYLPVEANGVEKSPTWYMNEPQIGPIRKPTPVAISIRPIFCSLSLALELETTSAIEATALTPEPSPPIIYATNDQKRKELAPSKDDNS